MLSYRDAFVLLLRFLATRDRRGVIDLDLPDLTTSAVVAFLEHLETDRRNSAVTRNARLAAIHIARQSGWEAVLPHVAMFPIELLLPHLFCSLAGGAKEVGRITGRDCERADVALGPRPSACRAQKTGGRAWSRPQAAGGGGASRQP